MIYYLMSVLAAVGCAGNFAVTNVYRKRMGNGIIEGLIFNMIVGLFAAVMFFAANGFKWEFTLFSMLIATLLTLFVGIYTLIGFKIMSIGSMTVYTVFLMLGGAVVPYLYGIMFLEETVNIQKILALLLVIFAVLLNLSGEKGGKQSTKFILFCFAVFFLNGATSVVSKLHQIETNYVAVSANAFVMLKSIVSFVLFAAALLFVGKKEGETKAPKLDLMMYIVMAASALISGIAYFLQLVGAAHMPATVLYPVVTGGTIVFSAVFDRMCFKQHLSIKTITGVVVCVLSLILFVL